MDTKLAKKVLTKTVVEQTKEGNIHPVVIQDFYTLMYMFLKNYEHSINSQGSQQNYEYK